MKKLKYLAIALALVLSFSLVTAVPALAAPVVASVTETAFGTDTTDHMSICQQRLMRAIC